MTVYLIDYKKHLLMLINRTNYFGKKLQKSPTIPSLQIQSFKPS